VNKNGLLVFSHSFNGDIDEGENKDHDMHASLITAVLNALKETQGETITAIHQVGYKLLLYEGILTYGILVVTGEDEPKLHEFLRKIVLKFELMYTYELHSESIVNRVIFKNFHEIVASMYNEMVGFDFETLNNVLELLKFSNISNFIIFETNFFLPILTSIIDPSIDFPLNNIIRIFREVDDLCVSEKKETASFALDLKSVLINGLRYHDHWIVCFTNPNHVSKFILDHDIEEIKRALSSIGRTEVVIG